MISRRALITCSIFALALNACSHQQQPVQQPVAFTAPRGFIAAVPPKGARYAWINMNSREQIVQWDTFVPPPKRVPPGQKLSQFVMCTNVQATMWELPGRHNAVQLRLYEQWDTGNAIFIYTHPKSSPPSHAAMYALTTACPQR